MDAAPLSRRFLLTRWVFLRGLGVVFFSAFLPLVFQIEGLLGPGGILPAGDWLRAVAGHFGARRFWIAPSLLWLGSGSLALHLLAWGGLAVSILLFLNIAPRWSTLAATLLFLSFIAAAQDFAAYQSDSMLMAAGFYAIFYAPAGLRPGLAAEKPPHPALRYLLLSVWFYIYFESGLAKILSGDPEWRHFTAMDQYYQNGPLPTWIGWYMQHLPHAFQAATQAWVLLAELVLVWMAFLPRRWRLLCFWLLTPLQIGMLFTANYGFLNLVVLVLGLLLLDDQALTGWAHRWPWLRLPAPDETIAAEARGPSWPQRLRISFAAGLLAWVFLASVIQLVEMAAPLPPLLQMPATALAPFRIADRYGLFAVMTPGRYEIEFQGSNDGRTWVPYPYRFKPQALDQAPKFFVPYQARFDWDLWFASLGSWREYPYVVSTQIRLLRNTPAVVKLFAGNPFPGAPPRLVRTVIYQYWFTTMHEKHATGRWWRRRLLGRYSPTLALSPSGGIVVLGE